MATIRENPVPVGRYWLYLIGEEQRGQFEAGVKGLNTAHPNLVRVIATTHHAADETGAGEPETDWVLFEVSSPAIWDFGKMGQPTVAGPEVKTEADVKDRPAPTMDPLDALHDQIASAASLARGLTGVIIGVGLLAGVGWLVLARKR